MFITSHLVSLVFKGKFAKISKVLTIRLTIETIMDKIFETNSSFYVKHCMESLIFTFQKIFASIDQIFILEGRLGTRL